MLGVPPKGSAQSRTRGRAFGSTSCRLYPSRSSVAVDLTISELQTNYSERRYTTPQLVIPTIGGISTC